LAANISGTDEDIQNRTNILSTAILPALGETSPVKFGICSPIDNIPNICFIMKVYKN